MSPRTSEGITRVSGRRCAALASAPRQREPYQSGHAVLCQPRGGRYSLLPTRPSRNSPSRAGGVAERYSLAKGHQHPWAGPRKAQLVDQLPDQPQPTPAKAHQRSGAGWGAALVADRRLDPAALHPDGHLDRLRVAGPIQDGVGGGLADGQDQVVDNLARDGGRQLLQAGSHGARPARHGRSATAGKEISQLSPAAGAAAVMAWRRVLQARIVQLCHPTKVRAAWRQPSRSPRQRPPAVTVTA